MKFKNFGLILILASVFSNAQGIIGGTEARFQENTVEFSCNIPQDFKGNQVLGMQYMLKCYVADEQQYFGCDVGVAPLIPDASFKISSYNILDQDEKFANFENLIVNKENRNARIYLNRSVSVDCLIVDDK